MERRRFRPVGARGVLGFVALFSGMAVLLNILLNVDLRLGLAVTTLGLVATVTYILRRAGATGRRWILRTFGYGLVAGVLATLAYDVARTLLAEVGGSPYRPFEAIVKFGQLLTGSQARDGTVILAGGLFHALNGASFGVAFTFVVIRDGTIGIRRAVLFGAGWGMFLEAFQLSLYPNWLGIQYFTEFLTISALGHLAYGSTLGPVARYLIRRSWRNEGE